MSARTKPALRVVPAAEAIVDLVPDIYELARQKRRTIDWAGVHVRGDRQSPVDLPDRRQQRLLSFDRWTGQ